MCAAPTILENGQEVPCRNCSLCRRNAIEDWVGRNIAESKTALSTHAVTLTYGRSKVGDVDHERAALLTYSDVQKYFKLLRRHGFPMRYFVAGEYGSTKGRAHWHVMLYWQKAVPPHVLDENFMEEHWPHGWSFWTKPTPAAVRYNCKYVQKDMGDMERQGHLAMSRKPPLGAAYFARLAEQYVDQGLAPQDLFYTFPGLTRERPGAKPEQCKFMLRDRSAELFLAHYVHTWEAKRPGQAVPPSELVEDWVNFGVLSVPKSVEERGRFFEQRSRMIGNKPAKAIPKLKKRVADGEQQQQQKQITWRDTYRRAINGELPELEADDDDDQGEAGHQGGEHRIIPRNDDQDGDSGRAA